MKRIGHLAIFLHLLLIGASLLQQHDA